MYTVEFIPFNEDITINDIDPRRDPWKPMYHVTTTGLKQEPLPTPLPSIWLASDQAGFKKEK